MIRKQDTHAHDLDYPVVESLLRTDFPMNPQEDVLSLRAKAAALLQLSTKLSVAIADGEKARFCYGFIY